MREALTIGHSIYKWRKVSDNAQFLTVQNSNRKTDHSVQKKGDCGISEYKDK